MITIDRNGNTYVVDEATGRIYRFDPDGSYAGIIAFPDFKGQIYGLATDPNGNLYISSDQGIAFLRSSHKYIREEGIYYSKTLDSGMQDCQWHRLALEADVPPKTIVELYYYSSDNKELKNKIDDILSDPIKSTQEKKEYIDNEIGTWIGPEKKPSDMLFREKTGRYLWLKLVLSTFDEKAKPVLRQMRAYYPRISYLRYLPAVYQEDPTSREFLERFLSLFETILYGLETEISRVFKYFDPDTTPQNFLPWLSSWLNLSLEEDWPDDRKRKFINEACRLYKLKGTPAGIENLIEIYTGKKPVVLEHSRTDNPIVLGVNSRMGINSLLIQTPIRGFRLGDDSILGRVALRDIFQSPEDPFLLSAHRFSVLLDLSKEDFARYEKGLRRIINEGKPAHTSYNLRIFKEMRAGLGTYIGINTRVADYMPISLGDTAIIGSGIVVRSGEQGGRLESNSRSDKTTELM